ncbi:MAG: hypothetical protein QOF84_4572 [Streptomyces sp.]|nr:hypothetical protein [Streptomyces sp.]
MPGRDRWRGARRAAAVVLGLVPLALAGFAGSVVVGHSPDNTRVSKPPPSLTGSEWRDATLDRDHPHRTFLTHVTLDWDHGSIRIQVEHRLSFRPDDPLVPFLHDGFTGVDDDFLSTVVGSASTNLFPKETGLSSASVTVRQDSADSDVVVSSRASARCPLSDCAVALYVTLGFDPPSWDGRSTYRTGDTSRIVEVTTKGWTIDGYSDATVRNWAGHRIALRTGTKPATVSISASAEEAGRLTDQLSGPQQAGESRRASTPETQTATALVLAVLVLGLVAATMSTTRRPGRAVLVASIALVVLPTLAYVGNLGTLTFLWWPVLAPVSAAIVLSRSAPASDRTRRSLARLLIAGCLGVVVVASILWGMLIAAKGQSHHPTRDFLLGLVPVAVAAAASGCVPWVLGEVGWRRTAASAGAVGVAAGVIVQFSAQGFPEPTALVITAAVALGLLWLPVLVLMVLRASRLRTMRWYWAAVAACLACCLYLPVVGFASNTPWQDVWDLRPANTLLLDGATLFGRGYITDSSEAGGTLLVWGALASLGYAIAATDAAATALLAWAALQLRRSGQDAVQTPDPRLVPVTIAGLLLFVEPLVVTFTATFGYFVVTALAVVAGFAGLLVPARRGRDAGRLMTDRAVHAGRLRRYARGQLLERARREVVRVSAARMAGDEGTVEEFDRKWRALGGNDATSRAFDGELEQRRALGGNAGFSAWENGRAGAAAALVIALPMLGYDLWALRGWFPSLMTVQILDLLRHSLRWTAYGFVYGYFFPLLPGRTPLAKAGALIAAMVLPETLLVLIPQATGSADVGLAVLLRLGETVTFGMFLGLWWERRIAVAGQVPWAAVRNLRSATALGAPATAVVVAVATTVATALAGAATVALLHSPSEQAPSARETSPAPSSTAPR